MKKILIMIGLLLSFSVSAGQINWLECDGTGYKVVVSDFDGAVFVEDYGIDDLEFIGTMTLTDKRSGKEYSFSKVLKTYNEFNEYTAEAISYNSEDGFYTALSLEFNAEEGDEGSFSANIPNLKISGELTCTMDY